MHDASTTVFIMISITASRTFSNFDDAIMSSLFFHSGPIGIKKIIDI